MKKWVVLTWFFILACGGPGRIQLIEPDSSDVGDTDTDSDESQNPNSSDPSISECRAEGFNFVCWYRGCFEEEEISDSITAAKDLGAEWFAVVPTWYQEDISSSNIFEDPDESPSMTELRSVISLAQNKGFKILLKPHVDLFSGEWRGDIDPDDLSAWQDSYRDFMLTMAELSEEAGVEILSVGTELKTRSGDLEFWRGLIADIREVFSGSLTYSANWDEYDSIGFWDRLDYVGIDFYFPLTDDPDASQEEMEAVLSDISADLEDYSNRQDRPFLFTEIGYRNVDGANTRPYYWGESETRDDEEQADAYGAVLKVFNDEEWLDGIFWWRWDVRLTGVSDEGYLIYGKPAADVLEQYWKEDLCEM